MSNIRVTYSGLIALAIGLTSVFTGILFTLIVTRKLTPEEFGIWSIIGSMISYFLVVEPLITYWSTRQIARGEQVGKTSLLTSIIFSLGILPGYVALAYFVYGTNHYFSSMILASILLPLSLISLVIEGVNLGYKPHIISYGLLIFESLKIPVGLILVFFLGMGINGAIIATIAAFLAKIALQIYLARSRLTGKFIKDVVIRWMKLSWVPFYSRISGVWWSLDVMVYSIITGSVIGVAYYAASLTVSQIIGHAGLISQALYPKLLANGTHEHVKENFNRLMYFAILFLTVSTVFAKPALFALNPAYASGALIAIIFAWRTFFYVLTSTFYQILQGIDTTDLEKNLKFAQIKKSKLFVVPTLQNIHYGTYIVVLSITLFILHSYGMKEISMVTWWVTIALILQIPFLIYSGIILRKNIPFSVSITNMIKYGGGACSFVVVYLLTSPFLLHYEIKFYDFLPSLIIELLICVGAFFIVTYLIDKNTRILFKSILKEFIGNKQ
ncbi:MAG: hypothetical protein ABI340_08155 [Nitrososphaera sp.]